MEYPPGNILIYSPDTDVYTIGLHYVYKTTSKQFIVQVNVTNAIESQYIHLNHLHSAFINDPDLAFLPKSHLLDILQSLFVCTGCDFVSFFKQIGKASFINYFFQHASFITGDTMVSSLRDTESNTRLNGFLSFVRLVGTVYFKKHLPSFISIDGHETPLQSFNAIEKQLTPSAAHKAWLARIRELVGNRIKSEEERVPSYTALWRH